MPCSNRNISFQQNQKLFKQKHRVDFSKFWLKERLARTALAYIPTSARAQKPRQQSEIKT